MLPNFADVISHSVTEGDVQDQYRAGHPGSVWHFYYPLGGENWLNTNVLPPVPPPYWTQNRDRLLRATILRGGFWADAVGIAGTKVAARSWTVDAENSPQLVKRAQQMMLALDGKGYVQGVQRGVRDFLTTDNGEFWEIVRASGAAGSRVLGLMHLDSLRCIRTGDDEIPLNYLDLKGRWHELKQHEVIMMVDMPSASAELFGIGLCAASRCYGAIYRLDGISTYFNEKIWGDKANSLHFISGVSEKSIKSGLQTAEAERTEEGYIVYKGVALIPVYSEDGVKGYQVDIKGVPDGFSRKEETDLGILEIADAIGLDLQDLQPLSGQGLGTGAQSYVQMEKAKGKGLAAREKDFAQQLNEKVLPDAVTFYVSDIDLTDEQKKADVANKRADTRSKMIANGEITGIESRALAVDSDDLPKEFEPPLQDDLDDTLSDEEKPETEAEEQAEQDAVNTQVAQPAMQPQAVAQQPIQSASKEHIDALVKLAQAIDKAKR